MAPASAVQGLPLSQYSTSSYSSPAVTPAYAAQAQGLASGYGAVQQQLSSQLGALYGNAMQATADFGNTDFNRIQNSYQQEIARQRQAAMSSGLGNNTILPSLQTGALQNEQLNLTANRQAANQNRLSAMGQFGLPAVQGPQQVALQHLQAQQGLANQYLALLGQMGTTSGAQYAHMGQSGGGFPAIHLPGGSGSGMETTGASPAPNIQSPPSGYGYAPSYLPAGSGSNPMPGSGGTTSSTLSNPGSFPLPFGFGQINDMYGLGALANSFDAGGEGRGD